MGMDYEFQIEEITKLAYKYRNAIDAVREWDSFRYITTFDNFPDDCCDLACDLLGQYLGEHGIDTNQVKAESKYNTSWRHVWLETKTGILIDITADQFKNKIIKLSNCVEPVYVGKGGPVQSIFCKNKVQEDNFIFKENIDAFCGHNKRQNDLLKIDEIVRKNMGYKVEQKRKV